MDNSFKQVAISASISSLMMQKSELQNKFELGLIPENQYQQEVEKIDHDLQGLNDAMREGRSPAEFKEAPNILEVDILDYVYKMQRETNQLEQEGKLNEVYSRRVGEKAITDMLKYFKERNLIRNVE